jgi:hypothetical protein
MNIPRERAAYLAEPGPPKIRRNQLASPVTGVTHAFRRSSKTRPLAKTIRPNLAAADGRCQRPVLS